LKRDCARERIGLSVGLAMEKRRAEIALKYREKVRGEYQYQKSRARNEFGKESEYIGSP
jgi:hypothetical protein